MGDRGNVDFNREFYLYTHYDGSYLPQIVAAALNRGRDRWDDDPYLARIIFSEMIQDDVLGTTGYGISPGICDNENPIVHVNTHRRRIEYGNEFYSYEEFVQKFLDLNYRK